MVTNAHPDRWVVIDDDEDADPFLVGSSLLMARRSDTRPGGAIQTDGAQYEIDFNAASKTPGPANIAFPPRQCL